MSSTLETRRDSGREAPLAPPHHAPEIHAHEVEHEAAPRRPARRARSRWVVPGVAALGVGVVAAVYFVATSLGGHDLQLVLHTAKRGDLPISIVERGTLESQENVQILCELDDVRGDGVEGTPITWLIRNGASVKKGDLLVEFASAGFQEQLDDQILETEAARAAQIQAQAKYDNQLTQNKTAEANAALKVKLAELDLEMYTDQEKGTYQLEVEEIQRLIEDINNEILAAQASLELKRNETQGIQTLFKMGYAGKSELDRSRLEFLQAEGQYAAKINKLQTQQATLDKKKDYEQKMQLLTLQGALETAKRDYEQVQRDNQALLDQAAAAKAAADESLKKEEERLARYRDQLAKCKIYAPQDGMVVYAVADGRRFWMEQIREGATVRQRQHILSLPNLKRMQVKLSVHESVLSQVKEGLPATVQVEALPDRKYPAKVKSVAVLADQSGADTKVYDTVVAIDEDVEGLRPDMTAVVEIHVAHLKNVIAVPVQAIVQVEKNTWCYVENNGRIERRAVTLGMTNDKFVEVKSGIEEGDQVILNPMAVMAEKDKDHHETKAEEEPSEAEAAQEVPPEVDGPAEP